MNVMVLDAEYNQPSRKTIQIGAAVYNARNAALIERFEIYVNPGEPINPQITRLTGITDQDVANGVSIQEGYEMLKQFHKKHKCFRNPLVWGSGDTNDADHLAEESLVKNISHHIHKESGTEEENFLGRRVIDVKNIFQSVALFEGSQYSGGLKEVCEKRIKFGFEGQEHTALADANNTFRVWYHYMRIFHDGIKKQK